MQAVWDEYVARNASGVPAFSTASTAPTGTVARHGNPLIEAIETVPVVLVAAADLGLVAMMDAELERRPITGGASIYPLCWSILLAARAYGLGGVMTTFLARAEPAAAPLLGLPPDHAIAATLFLGHPLQRPTKLRRRAVSEFATLDRFDGPRL